MLAFVPVLARHSSFLSSFAQHETITQTDKPNKINGKHCMPCFKHWYRTNEISWWLATTWWNGVGLLVNSKANTHFMIWPQFSVHARFILHSFSIILWLFSWNLWKYESKPYITIYLYSRIWNGTKFYLKISNFMNRYIVFLEKCTWNWTSKFYYHFCLSAQIPHFFIEFRLISLIFFSLFFV